MVLHILSFWESRFENLHFSLQITGLLYSRQPKMNKIEVSERGVSMIRIAICCGEGFASGFLSRYLAEATVKENLQDEAQFIFIPYYQLYDRQNEVDVALALPHIHPKVQGETREFKIPIYIIPFKVAIKPTARDYLEDAEDILKLANGKGGLFAFPDEERFQYINRLVSHRKWVAAKEAESDASASSSKPAQKKKWFGK